jgi:hypothetical protein
MNDGMDLGMAGLDIATANRNWRNPGAAIYSINTDIHAARDIVGAVSRRAHLNTNTANNLNAGLKNASMAAGAAALGYAFASGTAYSSFSSGVSSTSQAASLGLKGVQHFTKVAPGISGAINGIAGPIGLAMSVKSMVDIMSGPGFTGNGKEDAMKVVGAVTTAAGVTMGTAATLTAATSLIGSSSVISSMMPYLSLAGPGGWLVMGGVACVMIGTMLYKGWRQNQQDKVDDSCAMNITNFGMEGLGHEKFSKDNKYKEIFNLERAWKEEIECTVHNGQKLTVESFKALPAKERAMIRLNVANKLADRIENGEIVDPGQCPEDHEKNKQKTLAFLGLAAVSEKDSADMLREATKGLPYIERQHLFNVYAAQNICRTREIIGDPFCEDENGKMVQGQMKRDDSTKNQHDWNQVHLAKLALELGVSYEPKYFCPTKDEGQEELKKEKMGIETAMQAQTLKQQNERVKEYLNTPENHRGPAVRRMNF